MHETVTLPSQIVPSQIETFSQEDRSSYGSNMQTKEEADVHTVASEKTVASENTVTNENTMGETPSNYAEKTADRSARHMIKARNVLQWKLVKTQMLCS